MNISELFVQAVHLLQYQLVLCVLDIDNLLTWNVNTDNQISDENNNVKKDSEENGLSETNDTSDSEDVDSIESIPFMAEPAKKKIN